MIGESTFLTGDCNVHFFYAEPFTTSKITEILSGNYELLKLSTCTGGDANSSSQLAATLNSSFGHGTASR